MKKLFTLALVAALAVSVLAGCGSSNKNESNGNDTSASQTKSPEELTSLYKEAITANGGEMVEYNPVISQAKEDDGSAMLLEMMGLKQEDMTAFGISTSMMNVKAYGIAAVMPAEGKEENVKAALQAFIDQKCTEFESYLVDQLEVAQNAKLETLADGTVLMVMTEGQDEVFTAISAAIAG